MSVMRISRQFSKAVQPAGDYCSMYTCACSACGFTKTDAVKIFEYENFRCPECARRAVRKGVRNPLLKDNKHDRMRT